MTLTSNGFTGRRGERRIGPDGFVSGIPEDPLVTVR